MATPKFIPAVLPPSATAYCDAAKALASGSANGAELAPFSTLQTAYNSGARNLLCAPGTYGNLLVGAGETVVIGGNQIETIMGSLSGSGGCFITAENMVCGALSFTDHVDSNYAFYVQCEMSQTPTTYSGGDVGGHGLIQCVNCDFGDVATFSNFLRIFMDSYSEWQFFSAGGIVTSSVAGPVLLVATGLQGNAQILVNRDENLASTTTSRYVLPASTMSASRNFSMTGTAAVGQIIEVDSYNNSGFSAVFKSGAVTLATDVSSAHVTRYRFICTTANTTWALQSIQRLG